MGQELSPLNFFPYGSIVSVCVESVCVHNLAPSEGILVFSLNSQKNNSVHIRDVDL